VAFSKPGIFLVLVKNLNSENDLVTICERIIRAGRRWFQVSATQVYSGYDVGAAIISQKDTEAISLVRRATATMYQSNRYGNSGFELFPSETANHYIDPLAIESYISNALRKDLIELEFQPQYRSEGTLIGASAMIRMYGPGGQRLNGENFLPGVEERELVLQVSDRALGKLCFQVGDWLQRGISIPSVSFAVTAPHFLRRDFPKMVGMLLHNSRIPGTLLELELTESTIMTDLGTARRTLTGLSKLGVRFALRGVNMGPLLASCFPRLPITTLQLSCSPKALPSVCSPQLLRAAIAHGHRLGLRVTSRDIQSEAQMTALRTAGCDGFQGSLLSEPLSTNQMEEVLLAWHSRLKKAV